MEKLSFKPIRTLSGWIKAAPLVALSFFLCPLATTAQLFNVSDGPVYGDSNLVATATAISSRRDGTNNLDVLFAGTQTLDIEDAVLGYVSVSNRFDAFTITSGAGSLTADFTPALSVYGGTNLLVAGGAYSGMEAVTETNGWDGGIGGLFDGVATARVSNASFTGGTLIFAKEDTSYPPIPGEDDVYQAAGADGLYVANTHLELDGTTVTGGDGGESRSYSEAIDSSGGNGLVLMNATGSISNGTFRGGDGGEATGYSVYGANADGGHAVYVSNSELEINNGTFEGGLAGQVATDGSEDARGGFGLMVDDGSKVTITNGVFRGGSNGAAVAARNSELTILDGSLIEGGLLGMTSDGGTNSLSLFGGSYGALAFQNATNGVQFVTASNLLLSAGVTQDGGWVAMNLLDATAFNQITIESGTMVFSNDLALAAGGLFTLSSEDSAMEFQGLDVAGALDIGLGRVDSGTFQLKSGGALLFQVVTNEAGLLNASAAAFETNSSLVVDASLAGFSSGKTTNTLITTLSGVSGYNTNDVNTLVIVSQNTNVLGRTQLTDIIVNNDLAFVFSTDTLSNYWDATGQLATLADELDAINNPTMNAIINNMGAQASKSAVEQTYFTTLNTMQTAMQGLDAALGLAASRGTEFREQSLLPQPGGAKGPEDPANNWRFWGKYYGQFYNRDQAGANTAYDATLHGGSIGMDRSFGRALIGLSGGAGNYKIEGDSGASQSLNAAHGALYSTIGAGHSYLEGGLAYGFNKVDSTTAAPFTLNGDFDTRLLSGYLAGGVGFASERSRLVFTPEASARYTLYQQDAYTETSTTGVPRSFDEFDSNSLRASLGANVAMSDTIMKKHFGYKLEFRGHWLHEFNPEPGDLTFQLEGGGGDYTLTYPLLDEDALKLGFGLTFYNAGPKKAKNVLLRLDFDELIGENFNSHNLAAKVIYAF